MFLAICARWARLSRHRDIEAGTPTTEHAPVTEDVDDLAGTLFGLDLEGLSTGATTAAITHAILRWALARGWPVRTEARVGPRLGSTTDPRRGYIDAIVRRGGGRPDLAIEIDSTDKHWSLVKLHHAAEAGMDALWIRWGDDDWAGAYDGVDVIQLPALRRQARRAREASVIRLWS
jgi:hypothetical protein